MLHLFMYTCVFECVCVYVCMCFCVCRCVLESEPWWLSNAGLLCWLPWKREVHSCSLMGECPQPRHISLSLYPVSSLIFNLLLFCFCLFICSYFLPGVKQGGVFSGSTFDDSIFLSCSLSEASKYFVPSSPPAYLQSQPRTLFHLSLALSLPISPSPYFSGSHDDPHLKSFLSQPLSRLPLHLTLFVCQSFVAPHNVRSPSQGCPLSGLHEEKRECTEAELGTGKKRKNVSSVWPQPCKTLFKRAMEEELEAEDYVVY